MAGASVKAAVQSAALPTRQALPCGRSAKPPAAVCRPACPARAREMEPCTPMAILLSTAAVAATHIWQPRKQPGSSRATNTLPRRLPTLPAWWRAAGGALGPPSGACSRSQLLLCRLPWPEPAWRSSHTLKGSRHPQPSSSSSSSAGHRPRKRSDGGHRRPGAPAAHVTGPRSPPAIRQRCGPLPRPGRPTRATVDARLQPRR